jgi:hypothetical protein
MQVQAGVEPDLLRSRFLLLAAQDAEDDPVDGVRKDERRAHQEENKEPAMPDVEDSHSAA